jgi:hypothetical protein
MNMNWRDKDSLKYALCFRLFKILEAILSIIMIGLIIYNPAVAVDDSEMCKLSSIS